MTYTYSLEKIRKWAYPKKTDGMACWYHNTYTRTTPIVQLYIWFFGVEGNSKAPVSFFYALKQIHNYSHACKTHYIYLSACIYDGEIGKRRNASKSLLKVLSTEKTIFSILSLRLSKLPQNVLKIYWVNFEERFFMVYIRFVVLFQPWFPQNLLKICKNTRNIFSETNPNAGFSVSFTVTKCTVLTSPS